MPNLQGMEKVPEILGMAGLSDWLAPTTKTLRRVGPNQETSFREPTSVCATEAR